MLVFEEFAEPVLVKVKGLQTEIPTFGYTTVREEAELDKLRANFKEDVGDNYDFWCRACAAWLKIRLGDSEISAGLFLTAPRYVVDEVRNLYVRERNAGKSAIDEAIAEMIAENLNLKAEIEVLKSAMKVGTESTGGSDDITQPIQDSL